MRRQMTGKERWGMSEREKEKGEGWKNVPDSHGVYWRGNPNQAEQTRSITQMDTSAIVSVLHRGQLFYSTPSKGQQTFTGTL